MSDLLPPNATRQERALAEATARISDVPVPVRDVWNADTCPENLLPWLAWAFSLDDWNPLWSVDQKRAIIKNSIAVHRTKGTIGAVRDALAALGIDVRVQEWFNQVPPGEPYTFNLLLQTGQEPVTQELRDAALEVVFNTKNLRSHLADTELMVRSEAPVYLGAWAAVGHEYTLLAGSTGGLVINELAINAGD